MSWFSSVSRSFTDCVDTVSVNMWTRSSWVVGSRYASKNFSNINRLQTMCHLGESMFEILMKMGELDLQMEKYQEEARQVMATGASDVELKIYFQRIREVRIQKRALDKSSRTLMATVSSIESQENIEKIKQVLNYTVDTHRMAREVAHDDVTSESLLNGFEQISNTIEQEKNLLDSLDMQISELNEEPVQDVNEGEVSSEFLMWKTQLQRDKRAELSHANTQSAPALVSHMAMPRAVA